MYTGANIVRNGLVFGYDADDRSSRFYKGEPTINLYNTPNTPGLYFDESYNNGNYGFGISTNSQWVIDNSDQPILGEDVQKISRINSGVSQTLYIAFSKMVLSAGIIFSPNEIKSISFYYYGTFGTQISPYIIGCSSEFTLSSVDAINGNGTTNLTIPVPVNKWKRVQFQITNTSPSSNNFGWGWIILHYNQLTATLDNTEYWKFTGIQIESKNHMTQNVGLGKSRLLTSSLIDLTKTHTIDLSNMSFDSTAHPIFNGVGDHIALPSGFSDFTNGITMESFVKFTNTNGWARLFDFGNGAGSDNILIARYHTSNTITMYMYIGGDTVLKCLVDNAIVLNEVALFTGVVSSEYMRIYKNGILIGETLNPNHYSLKNIIRTNNYIGKSNWTDPYFQGNIYSSKIYNRALSPDEILQNYNALKSRFIN